jgi:hypothetical protein
MSVARKLLLATVFWRATFAARKAIERGEFEAAERCLDTLAQLEFSLAHGSTLRRSVASWREGFAG